MLNRQRTILYMLQMAGGAATRIQLMKWAFLFRQETSSRGHSAFYDFVPYKYGPYSFALHQDVRNFVRSGLIEEPDSKTWRLHSTNQVVAEFPRECQDAARIMLRYRELTLRELINAVYSRYPWFTINCENTRNRIQKMPSATPAVYTIGYQGLSIDAFLNKLLRSGIKVLADVRYNPLSRSFGFHKGTLSRLCSKVGIEYCGYPQLGIPPSERAELKSQHDYAALFARYSSRILTNEIRSLESLAERMRAKATVLVCMESHPQYCHRSPLASQVARIAHLPVTHIRGEQ